MAKESPFDPDLVRELANLIAETDLTEIEVEKGDLRIRVARTVTASWACRCAARTRPQRLRRSIAAAGRRRAPPPQARAAAATHPGAVLSPMVGTAYPQVRRPMPSPSSRSAPRSQVGDKVLLVEAMKTFNEIVAPRAGTVTAIFVEDGTPVEYGEPLLVIE